MQRPNLLTPQNTTRIATWNGYTLFQVGKTSQATAEMTQLKTSILGIRETQWLGSDKICMQGGEMMVY